MVEILLVALGLLALSGLSGVSDGGVVPSDDGGEVKSTTQTSETIQQTPIAEPTGDTRSATLSQGTNQSDRLLGDDEIDIIFGNGGNDVLRGGGGNDVLFDTEGADSLFGGDGDDELFGSGPIDPETLQALLFTHSESPEVVEQALEDARVLEAGGETDADGDELRGGPGDDYILAGTNDVVSGGDGADTIQAGQWIETNAPVVVEDFDPAVDVLDYYARDWQDLDLAVGYVGDNGDGQDAYILDGNQLRVILRGVGPAFSVSDINITLGSDA